MRITMTIKDHLLMKKDTIIIIEDDNNFTIKNIKEFFIEKLKSENKYDSRITCDNIFLATSGNRLDNKKNLGEYGYCTNYLIAVIVYSQQLDDLIYKKNG